MSKTDYYRGQKVEYVVERLRSEPGNHSCHWPGCGRKVPPSSWGCKKHWLMLPKAIQRRIWQTFRPGQEETKTPSREYIDAARAAQDWITENHTPERTLL